MAAIPSKSIYKNAPKYFKGEMTEKEKKEFEENLRSWLRIVEKAFKR